MAGLGDILKGAAVGAVGGFADGIVERNRARAAAALENLKMQRDEIRRQQDHDWKMEEIAYRDQLADGNRAARKSSGGGGSSAPTYEFLSPEDASAQGLDPSKVWQLNTKTGNVTSKGGRGGAAPEAPSGAGSNILSDEEVKASGLDPSKVYQRSKSGSISSIGDRATDENFAPAIDEALTASGLRNVSPQIRAQINQRVRAGENPMDVVNSLDVREEVTNPAGTAASRAIGWTPEDAPPDETVRRATGFKPAPAQAPAQSQDAGAAAVLSQARQAIAAGAPREAVIERLRQMGVPVDGL